MNLYSCRGFEDFEGDYREVVSRQITVAKDWFTRSRRIQEPHIEYITEINELGSSTCGSSDSRTEMKY